MEFLKQQYERIRQQLAGLNASQKMLAAALVVIMGMTLLYWSGYAGKAVMEPVLDQAFSSDDLARVTARIRARGFECRVEGDKVLVPADRKMEILADLGYAQLLPRDTRSGFDEIIKQMSPWDPLAKQNVMWNRAKEMTLSRLISQFPPVQSAVVVIDPTDERRISAPTKPSATISITMRDGEKADKRLINAAADVVSGAVSGIQRSRISIVVDGAPFRVKDRDDAAGFAGDSDIIDQIQTNERHYANKIGEQLSFIRGVLVSVTVDLNTKHTEMTKTTIDPKPVSAVRKEETQNEETPAAGGPGGETGTMANTSMTIPPGTPTASAKATNERTVTEYDNHVGGSTEKTVAPAGSATVVAATVRVPQSYFVEICKRKSGSDKEPDETVLQKLVDVELLKIRDDVKACTGIKLDEMVKVGTYVDVMPAAGSPGSAPASAGVPIAMLVSGHAKEIAVGALAVVSLFMVMMMVRKSTPAPVVLAQEIKPPAHLASGEDVAGEVGEGNPALDGMELDDDAIKTQQMLDQVSTMVDENPDAAANLVKRWMNRS